MIDDKPLIEWATFRTLNDHLSQMCSLGVCKLCARISGPILAGLFLFIGIMTFSISCGLYDSKKDDRFEYIPPPATVIAFHWMCCIFGTFFWSFPTPTFFQRDCGTDSPHHLFNLSAAVLDLLHGFLLFK